MLRKHLDDEPRATGRYQANGLTTVLLRASLDLLPLTFFLIFHSRFVDLPNGIHHLRRLVLALAASSSTSPQPLCPREPSTLECQLKSIFTSFITSLGPCSSASILTFVSFAPHPSLPPFANAPSHLLIAPGALPVHFVPSLLSSLFPSSLFSSTHAPLALRRIDAPELLLASILLIGLVVCSLGMAGLWVLLRKEEGRREKRWRKGERWV